MTKQMSENYVAVLRDEFIPGTQTPVDIFLKLSEQNYVMILKEGAKVNFENLHFPEKAEWLYVRKSEYHKCVGQALTVAGIVLESDRISEDKKTEFLSKAIDSTFKEIGELGFDQQSLEHSKIVCKSVQTLVANKPDIAAVITMMQNLSDELIRHSMMTSAIAVIIAKNMKWTLSLNLEKLALGSLLHDVGLKELPQEILDLPRHAMNRDQTAAYESHVYRGAEILRSMPSISEDIISMVLEHHENAAGQGYPRRLRDIKTNPFARIVALADSFVDLVVESPNNPRPRDALSALVYLEITLGQPFHKPAFVALKQALQGKAPLAIKKIV